MFQRGSLIGILLIQLIQTAQSTELLRSKFTPETYSSEGVTVGCGISFFLLWQSDDQELVGTEGSINYFYPNRSQAGSAIKLTSAINFKKTKLTYAWLEIDGYGDTKRFARQDASDADSYVANLKPDKQGFFLPTYAATNGFRVGHHFQARPLDELLVVPPASDPSVLRDLEACLRALKLRQ